MSNPVSTVDVPLSIFGSLDTELSPPDIPEGASPANNDVVFLPGSVSTRPGLNRVFATPIDALGPISYQKSFVTPSGDIKNLYLTQGDGDLWVEDVTNAPGTVSLLFQSSGAIYASSCTAQGREYIALSDGVHGVDMPLTYDGVNLWRTTQDGPGTPPTVTSVALAPSMMATSAAPPTAAIVSVTPAQQVRVGAPPNIFVYYVTFVVTVASTAGIVVNSSVAISGNSVSDFDGNWNVLSILGPTAFMCACYLPFPLSVGTGGTATFAGSTTLTRANNTVTCYTATQHNLQRGYQAQIQGAGTTQIGGGIASITLNNEDNPGLATVTTNDDHGLLPNNIINIAGVSNTSVGTAITNVAFAGGFVTITTSSPHGLSIGSEVQVAAGTATAVNGEWTVSTVPNATTFTYAFDGLITDPSGTNVVQGYSASDSGAVAYVWPLASSDPSENQFTVQTAPSSTTFTIQLSYTDGTWTGGTVSFGWDGTFFVTAILSTTSFQYQQYGPNAVTTTVGTVTPNGQATPGIHECQMSYLLASGDITQPSPPVTFVANGGQYVSVTQMATGPSNVVGRVLQFTGAGGAYFFYIPVPAQVNGLQVSTATQINDNTSTSVLLDFSDNTLYAAEGVSIPGNNLANQIVLGSYSGSFSYDSRLLAWGGRNKVDNLLNMGFDGGTILANVPTGWTVATSGGSLVSARINNAWQIAATSASPAGELTQLCAFDSFNAPILQPGIFYSLRLWLKLVTGGTGSFFAVISSASTGFSTSVSVLGAAISINGEYFTLDFPTAMPSPVPVDLTFSIYGTAGISATTYQADEMEIFLTQEPYTDNVAKISYVDNFGGFDSETGNIGAEDDTSPIRNFGTIRQALYLVTGTGLHETSDNDQTEPSEWGVDQVADNCGAYSIASVARNAQGIGSAGKDWMMWSGPDGAQIFSGSKPIKVSQEIQSIWDSIPVLAQLQCWVKNDESNKRCFFGVPTLVSMQVLVLDYRNIDGAAIAENPPIHISFTGKMIVSDLTRKWTQWTVPAWCGELMYRGNPQPQIVFGCANPSSAANSYILNLQQFQDDDFGIIPASYTTYFFVSHDQEQALQVGSHRHVYTMAQAYITGTGTWSITPLAAAVSNPFPTSPQFPLSFEQKFDIDFGINVETTRCAFRFQATPISPSLDSYFKLQKVVINMAPAPWAKVRGSAGGSF